MLEGNLTPVTFGLAAIGSGIGAGLVFVALGERRVERREVVVKRGDALAGLGAPSGSTEVEVEDLIHLDTVLNSVRQSIVSAGGSGFGVVDTTPGGGRVGLLNAWTAAQGAVVLGADERCAVHLTDAGLVLNVDGTDLLVDEVDCGSQRAVVRGGGVRHELEPHAIRPLRRLVPESASWRVRRVPEVLVWASTFAAISDSCDAAARSVTAATIRHDWRRAAPALLSANFCGSSGSQQTRT